MWIIYIYCHRYQNGYVCPVLLTNGFRWIGVHLHAKSANISSNTKLNFKETVGWNIMYTKYDAK